ncbi:hypothetical protein DSECCO2_262620 [anaerobic digester metagenome]
MKQLLTGDEAIARGAFEAGVHFASAYPGTPSTEILESISGYEEVCAEWAPNEKVALESAIGASIAGGRALAAMKHVGLNVAADPFFTFAYTGVNGGAVIITADEPGQHSAQNEQDNRNYAKAGKVPMFEPANSQECRDMVIEAYRISELYDCPVLIRMTTRVCHGKSIVTLGERKEVPIKEYLKDVKKYVCVPANAKGLRRNLEVKLEKLKIFAESTSFNFTEINNSKVGVISSGACYHYAKEVFKENASYLKLGFTYPMPDEKIIDFCRQMDTIYIIEENDPYIEERVKLLGFDCHGKDLLPKYGEMTPDVIKKAFFNLEIPLITYPDGMVVDRPPTLCAGCPHRGFFYELGKRKNVLVSGDIGCYSLGFAKPYNAMDSLICMGGGFSIGHGAQKIFNMKKEEKMRVVSVLGDSTFLHSGITSLMDVVYNNSNTVSVILDNRITGMTGHQENPGTGYNAKGEHAAAVDIEGIVRALGIQHICTINPNQLNEVSKVLDEFLELDEPSVIITKWPCALKKFSTEDNNNFAGAFTRKMVINEEKCIGCKLCMKCGCPAIRYDGEKKQAVIDDIQCLGCGICNQLCPKNAIEWKEA